MKCKEVKISKDVCYIRFGKGEYDHSIDAMIKPNSNEIMDFVSVNGDWMVIDLDKDGKVIGIELINDKPCQRV